jgi:hypothetical protein
MCRWLLRTRELVDEDFPLTQEFLAQMLGVRRSSVSEVATALQEAGLIHYTRGKMQVVDIDGLKRLACECSDILAGHHRRIFGDVTERGAPPVLRAAHVH